MADLTIDPTKVRLVRANYDGKRTGPANEALAKGNLVVEDATNARLKKADASTGLQVNRSGICIETANVAGLTVSYVQEGIIDLGDALAGLSFGAPVYASDTAGALADAAGTQSAVVGSVIPGWGNGATADKLLQVRTI